MATNPTGWFDANLTSKGWFDETLENAGWFDESAITVTSGGATTITGTMAATDSADTAAFVGDHGQDGILSATDAADSFAAAGDIGHVGTLSATDGADSAAVAGDVCHVGTLATTEEVDTASVAGAVAHVGSLAVIEGEDPFAASGTVTSGAATITGDLIATDGEDNASFDGDVAASPRGRLVRRVRRRFKGYRYPEIAEKAEEKREEIAKEEKEAVSWLGKEVGPEIDLPTVIAKIEREYAQARADTKKVLEAALLAAYEQRIRLDLFGIMELRESIAKSDAILEAMQQEEDDIAFILMAIAA